jgi:hypothetical protein
VVGQIVAKSGQVIRNVHVTTSSGPCIIVPSGVSNVTIEDNEVGPCGGGSDQNELGILASGNNVTIQRNVVHDVASGLYAADASHPIVFDRNYVYNIRGPMPRGQMVQFNGVKGGSGASKVTCNVSDGMPGTRYGASHNKNNIEDHINIYDTQGSSSGKVEIAYNRLRWGSPTSNSGSGVMMGDNSGAYLWSHDNVLVNTRNVGFAIAGGQNITHENNRVYLDGSVYVNVGAYVWDQSGQGCTGAVVRNNRVWTSNNNSFWNAGNCSLTETGNNFNDTTLTAAIFDQVPAPCN